MRMPMTWNGFKALLAVAGLSIAAVAATQPADPQATVTYGALPDGATSTAEATEIGAEICCDLLLNPSQIRQELPDGYRLLTAREIAVEDPGIGKLLGDRNSTTGGARLAEYAVGSLCFLRRDDRQFRCVPVGDGGHGLVGFGVSPRVAQGSPFIFRQPCP